MNSLSIVMDSNGTDGYVSFGPSHVQSIIGDHFGYDTINNHADSGDTMVGFLARIDPIIAAGPTRLLTNGGGTNEAAAAVVSGAKVYDVVKANATALEAIIQKCEDAEQPYSHATPILSRNKAANEYLKWIADAQLEVCNRRRIHCVDVTGDFLALLKASGEDEEPFGEMFSTWGQTPDLDRFHLKTHARWGSAFTLRSMLPHPQLSGPQPDPNGFFIFEQTLSGNSTGNNGYTMRQMLNAALLSVPSFTPTQMRLWFEASTTGSLVAAGAVGHKASSGNPYDFAATPVPFSVSVAQGQRGTSAWLNFAWDKTSGLVISARPNSGAGTDEYRAVNGVTGAETYSRSTTGDDTQTTVATGSYSAAGQLDIRGICKIEVRP